MVKTKRLARSLRLDMSMCFEAGIPEHYNTTGVDADLVVFFSHSNNDANLLAWSVPCAHEQGGLERPLAG
jgi:hypothetical protein